MRSNSTRLICLWFWFHRTLGKYWVYSAYTHRCEWIKIAWDELFSPLSPVHTSTLLNSLASIVRKEGCDVKHKSNSLRIRIRRKFEPGFTRELAPVLIRQILHSYWSTRATAKTVLPHHVIRATRTALPYKKLFTQLGRGPYYFLAGGVLCWKKSMNNYTLCICLTFWPKCWCFWPNKVFMNGNVEVNY